MGGEDKDKAVERGKGGKGWVERAADYVEAKYDEFTKPLDNSLGKSRKVALDKRIAESEGTAAKN